jgi:hypothetical protein
MTKIIYGLILTLLFSCSADSSKDDENSIISEIQTDQKVIEKDTLSSELEKSLPQVNDQFKLFLDEFPKIELPIIIKACKIDYSELTVFNNENPSPYVSDYAIALGQIKTNGNYIGTITLGAADCMLPVITTYKLNGEKIDSKTIAIGYCGSGPCFECEEFMTLKLDYELFTADTIKTADCDEDYNPIVGTEKTKIIYKKGRLTKIGLIELTEEIEEFIQE